MLEQLDLDHVYTNYGFPNDMLVHLNVWNARVRDFPSRPIYGVGERSNMRYRHVVPRIAWLLVRGFFWRLWEKYVKRDFHPLVFFYVVHRDGRRRSARSRRRRLPDRGLLDTHRDRRSRRAARDLRAAVHAVRDVVRHGVEQGPQVAS